jgi:hypothetical protein
MPLRGELLDPAAGPVPPEWGRFVAEPRLTPARDAAVLATLAPRHPRLRLGLVHDGGRLLAVFCGHLRGPGALPGPFECKLLPMGSTPGFAFARELGWAGRRAVVAAFERALIRRLGWRCLGVAYRQVGAADLDACAGPRRPRVATAPDTLLENRWATMEESFAGLPRHRRGRLRATGRAVARDPDLVVAVGAGVDGAEASRLAFLTELRHHRGRLDTPRQPIPAAYFDALAGRDGALYLAWRDAAGSLLAFTLLFDDGQRLFSSVWGALDPQHGGRRHLLFDQYLRVIAHAVEHHRVAIRFGKGELEAKQRFGCVPVAQFAVAAAPQVSRLTRRSGT